MGRCRTSCGLRTFAGDNDSSWPSCGAHDGDCWKGHAPSSRIDTPQIIVLAVTIFVTILVYFSTGWVGVGTLVIGTGIGLMPPRIGIRRSHAMGIILVPIMVYTFAQTLDGFGFI